jgi:hypothetical protein
MPVQISSTGPFRGRSGNQTMMTTPSLIAQQHSLRAPPTLRAGDAFEPVHATWPIAAQRAGSNADRHGLPERAAGQCAVHTHLKALVETWPDSA